MKMSRGDIRTGEVAGDPPAGSKPRFGLARKIILFVAAVLLPLGAVTWTLSVWAIRESMTDEFTSKGTAIATGLAMVHEVALQLRGRAGSRGVENCSVGLVHNAGGWVADAPAAVTVHILRRP